MNVIMMQLMSQGELLIPSDLQFNEILLTLIKASTPLKLALNNTAMRQQLWRLRAVRSKVEVSIFCALTSLTQNSGAPPPLVCNACATPCYTTSKSSHSSVSENPEAI